MRYQQSYNGDWIQPYQKGYKMRCCDCGLVHIVNFRIVNGKVQLQVFRDNKATLNSRKTKKYKLKVTKNKPIL